MSKRATKRKAESAPNCDSQNSSILDFFSQANRDKRKPVSLKRAAGSYLDSASSSITATQTSTPVVADEIEPAEFPVLSTSFEGFTNTQDSQAWSEAISEVGEADLATPFLFDVNSSFPRKDTQTESIISSFSDDSQMIRLDMINDRANSFADFPLKEETKEEEDDDELGDDILPFDPAEEGEDSVISGFSTQEPPSIENIDLLPVKDSPADLPHLSELKFTIPAEPASALTSSKHAIPNLQENFQLERSGMTDTALLVLLRKEVLRSKWDAEINAQMAKYGSIAKVCQKSTTGAVLYSVLDSWLEGNLIMAWCTVMSQEEIDDWIAMKEEDEEVNTQSFISDDTGDDGFVKSCPNHDVCAEDEEDSDEERMLFALSLSYVKSYKYVKRFVNDERVVAIWPDWTEIKVNLDKYGPCVVRLSCTFKADSLY